jgi:hypothetical protein
MKPRAMLPLLIDGKNTTFCTVACETKNKWLATIRPRIGYAADRILFDLTGGFKTAAPKGSTDPRMASANKAYDRNERPSAARGGGA